MSLVQMALPGSRRSRRRDGEGKADPTVVHSLGKGLELLELLAACGGEVALSDLAQRLKWDKGNVFRFLNTLVRYGYVDQNPDTRRYRLGLRLLWLEHQLLESFDLPVRARAVLAKLVNATGEAAHLVAWQRSRAIIIASQESPNMVAVNPIVGSLEPLHCTALGKAILMQLPGPELESMIASMDLKAFTSNTITSPERLLEHIGEARRAGYAVDDEEFQEGLRCIGAPVLIPNYRYAGAMGISGPASRMAVELLPVLGRHVCDAVAELRGLFSGQPSPPK